MLTTLGTRLKTFFAGKPEADSRPAASPEVKEPVDQVEISEPRPPVQRKVYGAATQYPGYEDYTERMQALAEKYPEAVRLVELGRSVQGRVLHGLTIGHGPVGVAMSGLVHGCEWATGEPILNACETVLEKQPEMLERLTIHALPLCNPDGYELSRLERPSQRGNVNAVDINRNFPANWGPGEYTSKSHCHEFGGFGDAPLSEPESQAMASVFEREPNLQGWLDFHSHGEFFVHPDSSRPAEYESLLGDLQEAAGAAYGSQTIQEFEPIKGSLAEYCESRGVLGVGVELGRRFKPINEEREQVLQTGHDVGLAFLSHFAEKADAAQ